MHIYRWDLDRTYLDTDIHSVRGLLRSAWERADQKRNIPGSAALVRALTRADPQSRVHVLSGSPEQMRSVLSEKLALDGIRVDEFTLKDNLGNLKRGRLRAVRGQLGYKLPHLLQRRATVGSPVHETLFGDDSEVDALVYSVYADAIAGKLAPRDLSRILEAGGAYSDMIDAALASLGRVGRADVVEDIFIHVDRGVPIAEFRRLHRRVVPIFSWFQAALVLWVRKRLDAPGVVDVTRACTAEADLHPIELGALAQDLVRRRVLAAEQLHGLWGEPALAGVAEACHTAIARLPEGLPAVDVPEHPDYLAFVRRIPAR